MLYLRLLLRVAFLMTCQIAMGQDLESILETIPEDQLELLNVTISDGIDLNQEEAGVLELTGLITPLQFRALREHIVRFGPLLSIYELQSIDEFDSITTVRLKDLVFVHTSANRMTDSDQRLSVSVRAQSTLERKRGYQLEKYTGNRLGILTRISGRITKRMHVNVTLEKDPGERLVDHISASCTLFPKTRFLERIVIGDYRILSGHGLTYSPAFRIGKSAMATSSISGQSEIRAHSGTSEWGYARGIAVSAAVSRSIKLALHAAYNKEDATLYIDSTSTTGNRAPVTFFKSINQSGLHRTSGEVSRKGSLPQLTTGGYLVFAFNKVEVTLTNRMIHPRFPYYAIDKYRSDTIVAKTLTHSGLAYTATLPALSITGEMAIDNKGSPAILHTLLLAPTQSIALKFLFRYYHPDYIDIGSTSFSENSRLRNEIGFYSAIHIKFKKDWSLDGYFDLWQHPVPQFNMTYPGRGVEFFTRLNYRVRNSIDSYLQYRVKRESIDDKSSALLKNGQYQRINIRGHIGFHLSRGIEFRFRSEGVFVKQSENPPLSGSLFYADLIYKPIGNTFSLTARIAFFDTPDYSTRIYAYENSITGLFRVPAYYGTGTRIYINTKVKLSHGMQAEFRIARTHYRNASTIGSGNELIQKPYRTDMAVQLSWRI